MAFVCTIEGNDFSGSVFKIGLGRAAMYPIGYDDVEDKSYVLFVSLDPVVADETGLEFSFSIIEYDGVTGMEHAFWSGRDTPFIPKSDRKMVLSLLAVAVDNLLKSENPARVFLCTRDSDAPEKANEKFIILAHVFERCGYTVATADPFHGQMCWWMERQAVVPI